MNQLINKQSINSGRRERNNGNSTTLRNPDANNSNLNRAILKKTAVSPTNDVTYNPTTNLNASLNRGSYGRDNSKLKH